MSQGQNRRLTRGRIGDALAPRDQRERSTMEGAGQRSGETVTLAWHAPMIRTLAKFKKERR